MNTPEKTEFEDCLKIADKVMQHLASTKWDCSPGHDFAAGEMDSPRLTATRVDLGSVLGAYRDVSLIRGSSGIRLKLPNQQVVPSKVTAAEKADIRRVIFGVLIHEYTHVIQQQNVPTDFNIALALEKQFHSMQSPSPKDCLRLYVGQPLEQEARASQAAAEIWVENSDLTRNQFDANLDKTEVWNRTETRIGGPFSTDDKVSSWWAEWRAMAWDTYSLLNTSSHEVCASPIEED